MTTKGGATDFARLAAARESLGPYCLTGGLAVHCYVETVYAPDARIVVIASRLRELVAHLRAQGFTTEDHPHSVQAAPGSALRIRFTTDERRQGFLARPVEAGVRVRLRAACLEDVARGKLWAYGEPRRRWSKRKQ